MAVYTNKMQASIAGFNVNRKRTHIINNLNKPTFHETTLVNVIIKDVDHYFAISILSFFNSPVTFDFLPPAELSMSLYQWNKSLLRFLCEQCSNLRFYYYDSWLNKI